MLDERVARLIAVGASVTANCQACLQTNIRKAVEAGADPAQVAEAVGIGKLVRSGAASIIDARIAELGAAFTASAAEMACECGRAALGS